MEAGGGVFHPGAASSPQEGRRRKTRRAGKKGKDARHRKVAQKRGMTDERRRFEVGEVLHALAFQLSVADVSLLPLEELGDSDPIAVPGVLLKRGHVFCICISSLVRESGRLVHSLDS